MQTQNISSSSLSVDQGSPLKSKLQTIDNISGVKNQHEFSSIKQQDSHVHLSPEARKLADTHKKAYSAAKKAPDIREDKVKEYRERLASGIYSYDSGKIADGILRESIRDKLAKEMSQES